MNRATVASATALKAEPAVHAVILHVISAIIATSREIVTKAVTKIAIVRAISWLTPATAAAIAFAMVHAMRVALHPATMARLFIKVIAATKAVIRTAMIVLPAIRKKEAKTVRKAVMFAQRLLPQEAQQELRLDLQLEAPVNTLVKALVKAPLDLLKPLLQRLQQEIQLEAS